MTTMEKSLKIRCDVLHATLTEEACARYRNAVGWMGKTHPCGRCETGSEKTYSNSYTPPRQRLSSKKYYHTHKQLKGKRLRVILEEKICPGCSPLKALPITDFYKDPNALDLHRKLCKRCEGAIRCENARKRREKQALMEGGLK